MAAHSKVDWQAVERDFRLGTFTLRELAEKHGCVHSAIGARARAKGWTQDRSQEVRQGTQAKLLDAAANVSKVHKVSKDAGGTVADVVQAQIALNTEVILGHRTRIASLADDIESARDRLMKLGDEITDIKSAATLAASLESLVRSTAKLIEAERVAFSLDDKGEDNRDSPLGEALKGFLARLHREGAGKLPMAPQLRRVA